MALEFTALGLLGRWLFALALVFCTYNPTSFSYISWILAEGTHFGPLPALVGVSLLIGWIIFLRATFNSLGWLGISLGAAFFACVIWLLVDLHWLTLDSGKAITWVALLLVSMLLGVGVSWSHIRRRLTGQFDVDETEH